MHWSEVADGGVIVTNVSMSLAQPVETSGPTTCVWRPGSGTENLGVAGGGGQVTGDNMWVQSHSLSLPQRAETSG